MPSFLILPHRVRPTVPCIINQSVCAGAGLCIQTGVTACSVICYKTQEEREAAARSGRRRVSAKTLPFALPLLSSCVRPPWINTATRITPLVLTPRHRRTRSRCPAPVSDLIFLLGPAFSDVSRSKIAWLQQSVANSFPSCITETKHPPTLPPSWAQWRDGTLSHRLHLSFPPQCMRTMVILSFSLIHPSVCALCPDCRADSAHHII